MERGASKRLNHFITLLRREFPAADLQFFRVGELQERGAIHYHNVIAGTSYLPHKLLVDLAVRAGFGFIVDVRPLRNVGGGCANFTKYFLKDVDTWPAGRRVWSCSARWKVAWVKPRLQGTYRVSVVGTGQTYVSQLPWVRWTGTRPQQGQSRPSMSISGSR